VTKDDNGSFVNALEAGYAGGSLYRYAFMPVLLESMRCVGHSSTPYWLLEDAPTCPHVLLDLKQNAGHLFSSFSESDPRADTFFKSLDELISRAGTEWADWWNHIEKRPPDDATGLEVIDIGASFVHRLSSCEDVKDQRFLLTQDGPKISGPEDASLAVILSISQCYERSPLLRTVEHIESVLARSAGLGIFSEELVRVLRLGLGLGKLNWVVMGAVHAPRQFVLDLRKEACAFLDAGTRKTVSRLFAWADDEPPATVAYNDLQKDIETLHCLLRDEFEARAQATAVPGGAKPAQITGALSGLSPVSSLEAEEFKEFRGCSEASRRIMAAAQEWTTDGGTILIVGESGCGKGQLAIELHRVRASKKGRDLPYVKIVAKELNDPIGLSMLFGADKIATDVNPTEGLLEEVEEGVLLINDLDTLNEHSQGALLEFVETHKYSKVGGPRGNKNQKKEKENIARREKTFEGLLVITVNRLPEEMIKNDCLRKDLYNRLRRREIRIPLLAERPEDAVCQCRSTVRTMREKMKITEETALEKEPFKKVLDAIRDIPGSSRGLVDEIELYFELWSKRWQMLGKPFDSKFVIDLRGGTLSDGEDLLADRSGLEDLLRRTNGNQFEAARILSQARGKGEKPDNVRKQIQRSIKNYGIDVEAIKAELKQQAD